MFSKRLSVALDDDPLLKISRVETGPPVLCQQSTDRKCSLRCSAGGGNTHDIWILEIHIKISQYSVNCNYCLCPNYEYLTLNSNELMWSYPFLPMKCTIH